MTTDLSTHPANGESQRQPQQWTSQQLETIRQTVARDANPHEFAMFIELCRRYQLDPFLREIWCVKMADRVTIMTGRDGYLAIAQRHDDYEGLQSMAVRHGDTFTIDAATPVVKHTFGSERGPLLGAWAICYRRGRRPFLAWADAGEYTGQSPIWKRNPSAMLCKTAEAIALKRQFSISGLVTAEETDQALPSPLPEQLPPLTSTPHNLEATTITWKDIDIALSQSFEAKPERQAWARNWVAANTQVTDWLQLTPEQRHAMLTDALALAEQAVP